MTFIILVSSKTNQKGEYESTEVKVDIFAKKIHPNYDDYTLANDICILKTKRKFLSNFVISYKLYDIT